MLNDEDCRLLKRYPPVAVIEYLISYYGWTAVLSSARTAFENCANSIPLMPSTKNNYMHISRNLNRVIQSALANTK